jgi:hypothetical protein
MNLTSEFLVTQDRIPFIKQGRKKIAGTDILDSWLNFLDFVMLHENYGVGRKIDSIIVNRIEVVFN